MTVGFRGKLSDTKKALEEAQEKTGETAKDGKVRMVVFMEDVKEVKERLISARASLETCEGFLHKGSPKKQEYETVKNDIDACISKLESYRTH